MPVTDRSASAADIAVNFLRLVEARRIDAAADLIDDQAKWWVQGIGEVSKQAIRGAHGRIMQLTEAINFDIHQTIEQDDAVALAMHVTYRFKDGAVIESKMCVVFTVAADRLLTGEEYMDPSIHKYFMPN